MSEQARYEVRTPMWLWMVNGVFTALVVLLVAIWLMFDVERPGL